MQKIRFCSDIIFTLLEQLFIIHSGRGKLGGESKVTKMEYVEILKVSIHIYTNTHIYVYIYIISTGKDCNKMVIITLEWSFSPLCFTNGLFYDCIS